MSNRMAAVFRNIVKTSTSYHNCQRTFSTLPCLSQDRRQFKVGEGLSTTWEADHEDVEKFSELTNNREPLHMDPEYAEKSGFGKRTVHWSLISGAMSGCVTAFMSTKEKNVVTLYQFIEHPDPLFIGEEIQMELKVTAKEGRTVTLTVTAVEPKSNRVVAKGKGDVLIPKDSA